MAEPGSRLSITTLVLLVISVLLLGLAGLFHVADDQMEAEKALARRARPAAVPIERFNPSAPKNPGDEVIVIGQIDSADVMSLESRKLLTGQVTSHWEVVPVFAATATDKSQPASGVLIRKGAITDDQLKAMSTGQGPFGPILTIDGKLNDDLEAEGKAKRALDGRVKLADNPVLIDPFQQRREVQFAADETHVGPIMVGVVGVPGMGLLILAVLRMVLPGRRGRKAAQA